MSEPLEIQKAKIDSLVRFFIKSGYQSNNRIGQVELAQFLDNNSISGKFDPILSEKLFQVLNLDQMSTITVEDFINGFLQFEEDIRRNAELYIMKLNHEQEIYDKLCEQCRIYKMEKLNSEGMCEDAKVFGEITDINVKKKLEGIKEIIIKVIYNEKSEELHFKIGDMRSNANTIRSFAFKPKTRKDHFEFIMKGVNDRNQTFDIGSKIFQLNEVDSNEEYSIEIVVPEIDNEEEIAAFIHAKIVIYWSDYKQLERLRRKSESRLKKLISTANRASEYLKIIREIYGDLTYKNKELIVDFNNEKLMQKKGAKINVNFNNQKEAETPGGNYLVEFNNSKEVVVENKTIKEETIKENIQEPIENQQIEVKETNVYTQVDSLPYITKADDEEQIVEYPNTIPIQTTSDYSYLQQTNLTQFDAGQDYNLSSLYQQTLTNGGEANLATTTTEFNEYNQTNYSDGQNNGMVMAETTGNVSSDISSNIKVYGTDGYELIDNNPPLQQLRDSQIIKETEIRSSVNKAMIKESTKETLFSQSTLPVKFLETKIKETIVDSNVKTLPLIYGRKSITYEDANDLNNYNFNNAFQIEQLTQNYTLEGQGNNEFGGNITYSTSI